MDKRILDIRGDDIDKGNIPIDVYESGEDAFKHMAQMMTDKIEQNNRLGKKTLFITPLGPVGQYKYFVEYVNSHNLSLKDVTFINMDEYMADQENYIPYDDYLSFRRIMEESCYSKINPQLIMPVSQRIFPSPSNAQQIDDVISQHGGVDICFGGIGINGHIAFNEPPETQMSEQDYLNLSVRVQKISRETRVVNSMNELHGAYYFMPEYCVTVGLKEIYSSKQIRLFCFRDWHRSVVRRASFGERSVKFPASLLQTHPDARIGISRELAE